MNLSSKTYLALVAVSLVSGCTAEPGMPEINKVEHQAKIEKKVVTTPIGKPSAPITMSYVISKENIKPGDEFTVDLEFQSRVDSKISINTNSFKKLNLMNTQKSWSTGMIKSGKRDSQPKLNFVATENGTFYIKLMAGVVQDGNILLKPFVVPVVVGDGAVNLQAVGEVITDEKGQRVIVQKGSTNN